MNNIESIKKFIIAEFIPDISPEELSNDHDLISDSVIDSIGTLKLIAWVEDHFEITVGDTEMNPENFRSINAIDAFISQEEKKTENSAGPRGA